MAAKGKRCKRCGQVNPVDETICIFCKSEDDLKGAEVKDYLDSAFKPKKGSYKPVEISEESGDGVANWLSFFAYVELICSPIAGLSIGRADGAQGWIIFLCGIGGGLILLGFSRIIQYLYKSVRYLRKIETLLQTVEK